jgi:transposase
MLLPSKTRVYLAAGATDMRKSINGLSILVETKLDLDPFSNHLFVFCNAKRNIIKILYWDRNGFCMWVKRLEKDKFKWPNKIDGKVEIDYRQLMWLIEGLNFQKINGHSKLRYQALF